MAPTESNTAPFSRSTAGLWALLALCFAAYPLALFVPTRCGVDFRFLVRLPVVLWGTVIAVTGFVTLHTPGRDAPNRDAGDSKMAPWRSRRFRIGLCWATILAGLGLVGYWRSVAAPFADIIAFAGLFAIPLYLAFAPDLRIPRRIGGIFAALWRVFTMHGLQQVVVGSEVWAVAGNRNWAAALLAATAPWAWKMIAGKRGSTTRAVVWGCIIAGLTLFLSWHTRSRAVVLVTSGYALLFLLLVRGPRWWRLVVLAVVTVAVGGILALEGKKLARSVEKDVRGPMWFSAIEMISDRPLTGHSPGAFRRVFVEYRSSLQMRSPKAAPVTIHPHNQLLYIAAVGGVPLAGFWAVMILSLLKPGKREFFPACVHYSAVVLVGCGLLDLTLFRAPTALLGLIMLGLHLRGTLPFRLEEGSSACKLPVAEAPDEVAEADEQARPVCLPCPLLKGGVAMLLVLVAGFHTGAIMRSGWQTRKAWLAKSQGQFDEAHARFLRAYAAYPGDIEPAYAAAEIALNRLGNPQLAFQHGLIVQSREPSFAHINGIMAAALERMRDGENAIAASFREARLFPYDVRIQSIALNRFLWGGRLGAALDTRSRLASARWRHLINQVGEDRARELAADFRLAVLGNRPDRATEVGNEILGHILTSETTPKRALAEPIANQLMRKGEVPRTAEQSRFGGIECAYWSQALCAGGNPKPGLTDGGKGFSVAVGRVLAKAVAGVNQKNGISAAQAVAEQFRLAGWMAAQVSPSPGEWPPTIEVRWGGRTALIILPDQVLPDWSAADLFQAERLAEAGMAEASLPAKIVLHVPARKADLWARNQALGDILREGAATGRPVLGESPTLYFQLFKALGAGPDGDGALPIEWELEFR